MIERYTLPEMGLVWSDQHKYALWCRGETLVLEAHAAAGRVPADVVQPVRDAPPPTPERVAEIEETTQHDVIAFLTAWADNTTPRSAAAYVHHGMTSSDLLDTALAVQLTDATDVLLAKADRLVAALRDHGLKHRDTIKVGRTHGVHAEPDVWGHRVADLAFAAARSRDRLREARARVGVVAISGAVGTYSLIDPSVEVFVAEALDLRPADASTQVVIRDSISEWVSALGIIATARSATRCPQTSGSACTPWVRPTLIVFRWASPWSRRAATSRSALASRTSVASVSCTASAVSSRSDDVMPWCT